VYTTTVNIVEKGFWKHAPLHNTASFRTTTTTTLCVIGCTICKPLVPTQLIWYLMYFLRRLVVFVN